MTRLAALQARQLPPDLSELPLRPWNGDIIGHSYLPVASQGMSRRWLMDVPLLCTMAKVGRAMGLDRLHQAHAR